ncbi:40S ribosomal protein S10 isoform X2 [Salmo salar]|uniref:40S ribosomal protein S10 isoform X2 n=1 Tax=Salmo salar TaxID=8030 RepID=A0ABM3CRF3_SALSA|nr:40S ribosomal protein S10 isoform X2 [Salmo salar]
MTQNEPIVDFKRQQRDHAPIHIDGTAVEKMLMPKKNRIAIYELLFKEGVMVAKKDVHLAKHPELADRNVPNLHVMKAMQSLKSTGYVKEQFAWRHFYWYLTNEGIQYLRDFLHLPPEIVPATLRRQMRPETARPRPKGMEGERGERPARFNREGGDRDNYRRSAAPPGADKKAEAGTGADKKAEAGAGAATEFQFRGGFGRGRGQQPPQE